MNDSCLVTKLKGSVDDNNLPILGELRFYILPFVYNPDGNVAGALTIGTSVDSKIEILSDNPNVYITDGFKGTTNMGKTFEFSAGDNLIYIHAPNSGENEAEIRLTGKYNLTRFLTSSGYGRFRFNIDDLAYSTNIQSISSSNQCTMVRGNIEKLNFDINKIYKDFLYLPYSLIEGKLENLIEKLYNKGLRDKVLSFQCFCPESPNLTFNELPFNTNPLKDVHINFYTDYVNVIDSAGQGSTLGTYDGSTWTYNS